MRSANIFRVADIIEGTSVDGPGLRTSIYFAGCSHRCPGCQNPQTWEYSAGKLMSIDEIVDIVNVNDFNVTFSGGDPLYQIEPLIQLAQAIKKRHNKNIWCYTGYVYEDVIKDPKMRCLLDWIDVLVDGPFIEELQEIGLRFRGSSNQRLIDCRKSTASEIVLWTDERV